MPRNTNPFLARVLPYVMAGVMIILFIIGMVIFSYVMLFLFIIGIILFSIGAVRARFFKRKKTAVFTEEFIIDVQREQTKKSGRLIEHDE